MLGGAAPAHRPQAPHGSGDDPDRRAAYELLVAAAGELADAPAQHYTGTVPGRDGRAVRLDARIGRDGTALSTVDFEDRGHGDLLDLGDDGTYARGDDAFWDTAGPAGAAAAYGTAWVRVDFDALGFDARALIPPVLAADLLPPAAEDEGLPAPGDLPHLGDPATVGGAEARAVRTGATTVWIATGGPPRIVRVETAGSGPAPSGPAYVPARAPSGAATALDVAPLAGGGLAGFRDALRARAGELGGAIDAQVSPAIEGQIKVGPCAPSSCQAEVTVSGRLTARSAYLRPSAPVHAQVTIAMTVENRPIKTCTPVVTMPAGGTATAQCTATYTVKTTQDSYLVEAKASASARALLPADVQRIVDRLATALPEPEPPAVAPPPCEEPAGAADGPGDWHPSGRPVARPAALYQEQVTGVRHGRQYRLGRHDFDGLSVEDGGLVLLEAKGEGYAWPLWGVRVGSDGRLVYADDQDSSAAAGRWAERARRTLGGIERQLRAEVEQVRGVPGARLRVVAAEQTVLDELREYSRGVMSAEDFARIEWRHEARDPGFPGCP
ncbi:hypothetical protein GCM10010170_001360 [Dactylosporangium salmoneum]|uniref:Uncharacterized protein n=1 Tax=Dactylosporangium salmoneum TaxID=53361 RepID=A0ABN3FBG6_9ACTN